MTRTTCRTMTASLCKQCRQYQAASHHRHQLLLPHKSKHRLQRRRLQQQQWAEEPGAGSWARRSTSRPRHALRHRLPRRSYLPAVAVVVVAAAAKEAATNHRLQLLQSCRRAERLRDRRRRWAARELPLRCSSAGSDDDAPTGAARAVHLKSLPPAAATSDPLFSSEKRSRRKAVRLDLNKADSLNALAASGDVRSLAQMLAGKADPNMRDMVRACALARVCGAALVLTRSSMRRRAAALDSAASCVHQWPHRGRVASAESQGRPQSPQ